MIQIHATKKLAAKLSNGVYPSSGAADVFTDQAACAANPLSGWHANLLTIQRRNCVLMVHDASRFALFMPGLLKADFANLDWLFRDSLMNTLLKADMGEAELERAEQLLALPGAGAGLDNAQLGLDDAQLGLDNALLRFDYPQLRFDCDCDRSVQGTLNRMAGDLEHMLAYDGIHISDCAPYRIGAWLSNRPCTIKGRKDCLWPNEEMAALLRA